MADVKWIKIVTDIFDDEKMLLIESMPEKDAIIVIWFKLLCLAGKQNNSGVFVINDKIAYTDEMLATIFRRPLNTVRLALSCFEQYGMIEIIDGTITIPNWEKHQSIDKMEQLKEQNRKRVAAHREKQRLIAKNGDSNITGNVTCNGDSNITVRKCNATDKNRLDKNRLDKSRNINNSDDDVIYARTRENILALYQNYFCSNPTDYEIGEIYKSLQHFHEGENRIPFSFDNDDKELLEIAFEAAAKNNSCNVAYIEGVFRQMWRRGIRNVDEYWQKQFDFDKSAGKV